MKKGLNIAIYICLAIATVAIVFAIIYHNGDKSQTKEITWIKSGSYNVGKEIVAGEYVLIYTGKNPSYEVIKDNISVAKDTVDNHAYITVEKGQTVKLIDSKMCKVDEAPTFKPENRIYEEGLYKVGRDMNAGEYILTAEGAGYYAILSDTKGSISSVVENNSFSGQKTISLQSGQYIKILDATMKTK